MNLSSIIDGIRKCVNFQTIRPLTKKEIKELENKYNIKIQMCEAHDYEASSIENNKNLDLFFSELSSY